MTPLRQRFIEDMQLRGLAPTTQRSYTHYVAEFAQFYHTSPEHLDLEAVTAPSGWSTPNDLSAARNKYWNTWAVTRIG
jgi:hypothetical protein